MGAADDHHQPHPSVQIPDVPCYDIGKKHSSNLPNVDDTRAGQVERSPSTYEFTGKLLLAASGAFAGILLALIVLHMCGGRSRRSSSSGSSSRRQRRRLVRSLAITGDGDDRDGGAAPSQRGLDPAVLRALPVVVAAAAGGDCAVCLAEFEAGEKARALPRCGHRFHVECIDAWFRENSTCPLCRADVEAQAPDAAGDAQPEVRIDITGDAAAAAAAEKGRAPAMGRLASGTDLEKTRRVFASTRSASF
uniref:RING-type domain-containing protein n=1 Tax=Leersia perrieri TaxID=77586 RepID=A0A0D9V066_9ORYZ